MYLNGLFFTISYIFFFLLLVIVLLPAKMIVVPYEMAIGIVF